MFNGQALANAVYLLCRAYGKIFVQLKFLKQDSFKHIFFSKVIIKLEQLLKPVLFDDLLLSTRLVCNRLLSIYVLVEGN